MTEERRTGLMFGKAGVEPDPTETPGTEQAKQVEPVAESSDAQLVIYTSHPVMNFEVGGYQFSRGQLKLTAEEAEGFDAFLATMPPIERASVRKIDVAAGNRIAEGFLQSRSVRGVDSSGN